MSLNTVALQGTLGKDVDLRYTQSGKAVASLSIAVQDSYAPQGQERHTNWINVVFWNKTAETIANHFSKGDEILVTGRLSQRSYESEGQTKYIVEVVGNEFSFTRGKKDKNGGSNQQQSSNQQKSNQGDPLGNASKIDISDDALPF